MSTPSSQSHSGARAEDINTRREAAGQGTHAAAAAPSLDTPSEERLRVQHVTYARLPCRWVPGPPIACLAATLAPSTTSAAAESSPAPVTAPDAHETVSSAPSVDADVSAAPIAANAASPPAPPLVSSGGSGGAQTTADKSDSAFHAAQHFLSTSGASLLYYANPSFYLTVRSGAEGQAGSSSGVFEELTEDGQRNLLSSPAAAAALRERYDPNVAPAATAASAASPVGVEWKKLEWVRQQCRYTGTALTEPQPADVHPPGGPASQSSSRPPPSSPSASAVAQDVAPPLPDADASVGARLLHTLLHRFAASSVPAIAGPAASAPPGSAADTAAPPARSRVAAIPHGVGVMTYVLYAKSKGGYGYAADTATPATAPPVSPFLSPLLIPTSYCPPLAALEAPAATTTSASTPEAASPPPLLLLALVVYEGGFERGRRHGRGRLTAYGRVVLECTWVHDVPCLAAPWPRQRVAAPTLWRIDAHVGHALVDAGARGGAATSNAPSPPWAVRVQETYMGALSLATAASRRLAAKVEALVGSTAAAAVAESVTELHGARYVPLPIPQAWCTPPRLAAASTAFTGLAWVNSTVFLPNGFGEAHHRPLRDGKNGTGSPPPFRGDVGASARHAAAPSSLPASALPLVVRAPTGVYHPPLWVPEGSTTATAPGPTAPASLVAQYCGQWSVGLPHGFGAALQRLCDPTAASLAMSAATAGAGPPQYPWRTLFIGQYVSGVRRGPGTYHAAHGSEATEVVVCGTWPRSTSANTTSVNVVLLPVASGGGGGSEEHGGSPRRAPTSPSFFSLQGARWEDAAGDDGNGGGAAVAAAGGHAGGAFPSATLRQTSAALSGMWEPVFRIVDDVMAHRGPTPPLDDVLELDDNADADAREEVLWQRACAVMDAFLASPECVAAMRCIQACFAFIYGADGAAVAADTPAVPQGDAAVGAGASAASAPRKTASAAMALLGRLDAAAAAAPSSVLADAPMTGYPWCPQHSWCAMAHLHAAAPRHGSGSGVESSFASCLHAGLQDGATHATASFTPAGQGNGKPLSGNSSAGVFAHRRQAPASRPPLSAVTAALEPYAAAHTFTHAMHAAAALVSSLRLRLLSSLASYPDLCEVVMGNKLSEDRVVQHAWRAAFRSVGAVLLQRATAIAVADVRLVWAALGVEVTASAQDGIETLSDFVVALRRCRGLQRADVATLPRDDEGDDEDGGGCAVRAGQHLRLCIDGLAQWLERQERLSTASPAYTAAAAAEDALSSMVQLLSTFSGLLHDTPSSTPSAPSPPQQEALLRWAVLAACTTGSSTTTRNPFAFLLIAHFLLRNRVAPGYPVASDGNLAAGSSASPTPPASRLGLLRCLRGLARATHQLMRTYPSVRARAPTPSPGWASALVCPLDVLACRAEYAFAPCAALHLCATAQDVICTHDVASDAGHDGSVVVVSLESLSPAALAWCWRELSSRHSSAALQQRLSQYWARLTPTAPGPHAGGASPDGRSAGDDAADAAPPPPTPLMRWVLACVQGVLSSPLLPCAVPPGPIGGGVAPAESLLLRRLGTAVTPPPPPTAMSPAPQLSRGPPAPTLRHSWRKFISATFFTAAEREPWGTAATAASPHASPARALTLVDECFLIALACTLRELADIELRLVARFVFDEADEEDEDADAVHGGGDASSGLAAEEGAAPPLPEHGSPRRRPLRRHQGGRKNIFLSSSSSSPSSSAVSDDAAPDSPAATPPSPTAKSVDVSAVQDAASGEGEGGEAATARHSAAGTATSTQPSTPKTHPRWADASAQSSPRMASPAPSSAQASPHDSTAAAAPLPPVLSPGRLRSQSAAALGGATAASSAVPPAFGGGGGPVGKEWELTLQLPASGRSRQADAVMASSASTALCPPARAPPPFLNGLAWEVMERVCTSVMLRLQSTTQPGDAITASAAELDRTKAKKGRGTPRGAQPARAIRK